MVEVTQADRLAAAQIYQRFRDHDYAKWIGDGTNAGGDFDTVIQAFARHRLAGVKVGLDAAAERADELFFSGEDESIATVIADEIRAIDPASVGADHDA